MNTECSAANDDDDDDDNDDDDDDEQPVCNDDRNMREIQNW